ncbi:MAG: hypothetical protein J6B95_08240 [Oscillospiraceae bacterium]|nr:hypothetical protein [Oscillospiraceae bacterium]
MDGNYSLSDIAAVTDGNRNGGMFGGNGDWGAWIILFLLFGMFNGRGFGGFGGFGGGSGCGAPCATQADVRAAVDQQTLISKLDQQTYGLADSTYALTGTITNGFHGVERQLADCCCATQRAIDGVNYNMAKGFCDLGNVVNTSTRDIIDNANCNTRAILDFLTNDKIATLTAENQNLKLAASQANQNSVLMAAMDANKAEILRRTGAECPTAAYIVQPPTPVHFPYNNCCGGGNSYGYGVA